MDKHEPNQDTIRWVLRGCEVCHGDLYESETIDGIQYFECLMCQREHGRKSGTKIRPKLL